MSRNEGQFDDNPPETILMHTFAIEPRSGA
jgi:hypothetical protein